MSPRFLTTLERPTCVFHVLPIVYQFCVSFSFLSHESSENPSGLPGDPLEGPNSDLTSDLNHIPVYKVVKVVYSNPDYVKLRIFVYFTEAVL